MCINVHCTYVVCVCVLYVFCSSSLTEHCVCVCVMYSVCLLCACLLVSSLMKHQACMCVCMCVC